jgi:hypothetical protein
VQRDQKLEDKKKYVDMRRGAEEYFSFRIAIESRIRKSGLGQMYQALK